MLRRVDVVVWIVALVAAAACGSVQGGTAFQGEPYRIDAGGRWGSTWVVEELRIGVAAEPQELVFDHIAFIAVDRDGASFVVDASGRSFPWRLRSYSAGGSFLRQFGEGDVQAEERRRILGLKVLSDGRLAVYRSVDNAHRLEFFAGTGAYVGGFQIDRDTRLNAPTLHLVGIDGALSVRASRPAQPAAGSAGGSAAARTPRRAGGVAYAHVRLTYSDSGQVLDVVRVSAPPPPDPGRPPPHGFVLRSSSGLLAPFSTSTLHSWTLDGYLVAGRNDAYEIEVRGPGAPVLLSRNVEPARLANGERVEWEEWNQSMEETHRLTSGLDPSVEHAPIPATKPYFRDILVGDGGRIWVHRYVRAERREPPARRHPDPRARRLRWMEPPTFDVFDPDGTFLATVVLPHDTRVLAVRDRRVWAVHMDEASVERVVRLRVESEGS